MNRPIKFRAWDKYNKSMIKPCLTEWIDFEGNCYFEPAKKYNTPNTEIYPTDDYILMQFTGLHDKNGKEIYEGDLIRVSADETFIGQVEYRQEVCAFEIKRFSKRNWNQYQLSSSQYLEVIGNIYENPELIPEGE